MIVLKILSVPFVVVLTLIVAISRLSLTGSWTDSTC